MLNTKKEDLLSPLFLIQGRINLELPRMDIVLLSAV